MVVSNFTNLTDERPILCISMFQYKCVNPKSFVKNLKIFYLLNETDEVWKTCQHYLLRIFSMKFCLIYLPSNSINAALIGPNAICIYL